MKSEVHELWSCDPSEIPEWTPDAIKQLDAVLTEIFSLDQEGSHEAIEHTRCGDQGPVVILNEGNDILE